MLTGKETYWHSKEIRTWRCFSACHRMTCYRSHFCRQEDHNVKSCLAIQLTMRIIVIISALFMSLANSLVLFEPIELYFNSPQSFTTGPTSFNITGQIVLASPENGCQTIVTAGDVASRIFFVYGEDCSLETKARNVQAAGGIAMIHHEIVAEVAGINSNIYIDPDRTDITIPIVFVASEDGLVLRNFIGNSTEVLAVIASGDRNAWEELATSPVHIFVTILHCTLMSVLVGLAVYKFVWFYRHKHTVLSVPQMSMTLLTLAALTAIASSAVGQLTSFRYLPWSGIALVGLPFISMTLVLLSALVISFYWFELTSSVTPVSKAWSKKLWKPFLIGGGVILCAVALLLLWPQYFRVIAVLYVIILVYAVIVLSVAVIWTVFGVKLRGALMKDTQRVQSNGASYTRLFRLIVASTCFLVLLFLSAVLTTLSGTNPASKFAVLTVAEALLEAAILVQLLMFSTRQQDPKFVPLNTE